jgi:Tol biopolymer transport system component
MVFFSPDGSSIGFFAEAKLKKTSLSGGSPITLYDTRPGLRSGDWFEDTILFAGILPSGQGLYRVSANGGEPEMLATPNPDEGETAYGLPDFLPGGKDLLFTIQLNTGFRTALLSLETGERKVVLENARQARYLSTGHLVYEQSRTGNLMVAPFDLAALEVTGESVPVVQGVRQNSEAYVDYAVSDNGTLVYVPNMGNPKRTLIWVDREGRKIEPLTETLDAYYFPRLSPDGKRLAVGIERGDGRDIWVYEINLGTRIRLTIEGANEWPVWTRDGSRITFQHNDKDLYWTLADGSGEAEPFLTREHELAGMSWRPGEQRLAFYEYNPVGARDIWTLSPEGDASPFLVTSFNERSPIFSPDGQWLTYVSNESGRDEVYVQPYPGPGRKWPISREGGAEPTWSPDGRELFFRQGRKMMVVTVHTGTTFTVGEPRLLFEGEYLLDANGNANYDVFPDGTRFVMIEAGEESAPAQINIVLNWFEELKRLVPTN